ncbi:type I-E CRISPR-associated protein Cas5/CasD [Streptomyces sp. SID4946]|uniref:type I-E CRISPR-associated protein Cas5/CasD n=1 Tax=Streptomyces sp. LamerLS-31b TaxID=1839765 RepID=UPI00081DD23C|nr:MULTISPECIES: type I-E CRISPR-associated protein Cas5/CasD [unclassified Streptomyces]MYQ95416.1 type I-E CRISPR-associated protein Cas5/CasD [Streptomyces sp. SID4946]SCF75946.1 CRISPR-associated protein, Cas5e family [Streptomyces sp. LamerLS-31b]SCF95432.1 CRISPR-associated protein, Cas5e family [Streptomyces sp. DconLS]
MTGTDRAVLMLRLAAPLQSWGGPSRYNLRETHPEPTKSGVLGLLAAAEGRTREASLTDLVGLQLGVRVDQPGTLLRDYHTSSDYRGLPLLSAKTNAKGQQTRTTPPKYTSVTRRFYLQDAVFVAALRGPRALLKSLEQAVRNPVFPLSLGRRSCPPTGPVSLGLHADNTVEDALQGVAWQAGSHRRRQAQGATVSLEATVEDPAGDQSTVDVPDTYDLKTGTRFGRRTVRHLWIPVPTGRTQQDHPATDTDTTRQPDHDPFALLGW